MAKEHFPSIFENFVKRPLDDANFQLWLQDNSDDMRDLRLSFWGNLAPSIGFRGLEAQLCIFQFDPLTSIKQTFFVTRIRPPRGFAFWPVSGECFAPYWEQDSPRRTASDLAYHQSNAKAKIGSWHHQGVDFGDFLICSGMHSKVVLSHTRAILNALCTNMGSICRMAAEIEIFRKCAKIGSVSDFW